MAESDLNTKEIAPEELVPICTTTIRYVDIICIFKTGNPSNYNTVPME